MSNLNRIIIVGRVNSAVDLKYTAEGSACATFSLVAERPAKDGAPAKTDAIDIVAWNKTGEICAEYLEPGKLALVEGRVQVRTLEADNGRRKYITEVVAQNMRVLEVSLGDFVKSNVADDNKPAEPSRPAERTVSQPPSAGVGGESKADKAEVPTSADGPFYTEDDIPF